MCGASHAGHGAAEGWYGIGQLGWLMRIDKDSSTGIVWQQVCHAASMRKRQTRFTSSTRVTARWRCAQLGWLRHCNRCGDRRLPRKWRSNREITTIVECAAMKSWCFGVKRVKMRIIPCTRPLRILQIFQDRNTTRAHHETPSKTAE